MWNALDGTFLGNLTVLNSSVDSVAWNPDGSRLASGSGDWMIRIWNPKTGALLQSFRESDGPVISVAWNPDGERLATRSWYGTTRIRNVSTGDARTLATPAPTQTSKPTFSTPSPLLDPLFQMGLGLLAVAGLGFLYLWTTRRRQL